MARHEHWYGPQPSGGEMRPHDHDGGDLPHHHLFAKEALVTIPQDEYEFMRKAAALAHAPTCEHLRASYERSGAGPGMVDIDLWPDGRWIVQCTTSHREQWRARGATAVEALRAFIAMHA